MDELKNLIKKYSYYSLDENNELLILQKNTNGYLIIKQIVELSEVLTDLDISHDVCANSDIKLNLQAVN